MLVGMEHRKQVKHYHERGHLHELTFSCHDRRPLLTNDAWCELLARTIDEAGIEEQVDLVAFVFMPEHVHLLINPKAPKPDLGAYLARVKREYSARFKQELEASGSPLFKQLTVQERPGKQSFRCWLEGPGYDRNVFSPEAIQASIDYIHNNPVRRGLRRNAVDWRWSSARFYLLEQPGQQFDGLPRIHGLPPGALD